MGAQGPIDRTPGQMVVIAYALWFASWTLRLFGVPGLAEVACVVSLLLILGAIVTPVRPGS